MNPQLIYQLGIGRQDPIPVKNGINYNNNNELEKWVRKNECMNFSLLLEIHHMIFDTTNNISFWHERNNQVVTWLRSLTRDFIQEIAIALCSLSHSYVHSFVLLKLINNR